MSRAPRPVPATATPPRTNGQAGASATAKAPSAVRPRAPQTNGRAATRESRPRPAVTAISPPAKFALMLAPAVGRSMEKRRVSGSSSGP